MRIYAVADIHGKPKRIGRIREQIAAHGPDLLIVAGDMARFFRPEPAVAELARLALPVLAIRGNSDRKQVECIMEATENIESLHLRRREIAGITIAGIGGTIPIPFRSRIAFREEALVRQFVQIASGADVWVAHPPPYGSLDRVAGKAHAGWKRLAVLMAELSPTLILCGHIHESAGFALTGRTMIVNCAMGGGRSGAIIDLEKGSLPKVQMV